MSSHPIVDVLNDRFAGVISSGAHPGAEKACILEIVSAARGLDWTDSPESLDMPDIRRINDAFRSDGARTLAAVRLGVALWDYPQWGIGRRIKFSSALALATVRELLPGTLRAIGLRKEADDCESAKDLARAASAARPAYAAYAAYARAASAASASASASADAASASASAYASAYVAYDASAATYVASAAARASAAYAASASAYAADARAAYAAYAAAYARAASASADTVLTKAVDIWVRCAGESE